MKSMNIKIPMEIAIDMSNRGELNPIFIGDFIDEHVYKVKELEVLPAGLVFNYTFKIDNELHKKVKLMAITIDKPMNELIGMIITTHYK